MRGAAALLLLAAAAAALAQDESRYWAVDFIPTTPGSIEVGGMDFLPDGRLVVSTRRGQVWIVENPTGPDPKQAKLKLFAEGLYEGLGLEVMDGEIHVLQRGELSRLRDTDRDGTCDTIDTIADDWGVSGNYHEFAYGLPRDAAGRFWIALNVSFFEPKWWHGKSTVPGRGWVLRVEPDGRVTPIASGFRSPNGLGFNRAGDLFVTDNQGDWMPAGPIFHVKEGGWYGHPASLDWTEEWRRIGRRASDTEPPERARVPAAVWLPYGLSRSAGNPLLDDTGGKFGPFDGQMLVAELTNGSVLRCDLEQVEGEYQGACFPLRRDVGSANRIAFAPDGTLFVGLTSRGWGGAPPADGLARVRWLGRVPMEMKTVRVRRDGFDVGFTLPLAPSCAPAPADVSVVTYDYNWWWDYGSPEMHVAPLEVAGVEVSQGGEHLIVRTPGLEAGKVARIVLRGIVGRGPAGDEPLLHPQADYTVNRLPGMKESVPVAKKVEPPSMRESFEEGALSLFDRRVMSGFDAPGWRVAGVHLDPADPSKFTDHPLVDEWDGCLVNAPGTKDAFTRFQHGDCDARIDFCLPRGGNSGVYFMGRYEVQLLDSFGKKAPGFGDCGGIYEGKEGGRGFPGSAPSKNASNAPGEWQRLEVRFRAPRFDADGKKTRNARFDWVKLNGERVQEDVEVGNPTRGALPGPEARWGPLRLQGDHGPVAFRKVRLRRLAPEPEAGWTRIFDGRSLEGWKTSGQARWTIEEGAIVGRGPTGHLFSPRADYRNLEQRAKVRINEGGNSGFYFRTAFGDGWPKGYEAQVNHSFPKDPQRTGGLYDLVKVPIAMVADDVWFELRVRCVDEEAGTHVTIWLNDVITADFTDRERRHASGHLALQQHHEGSEVRFRDVEVRELP